MKAGMISPVRSLVTVVVPTIAPWYELPPEHFPEKWIPVFRKKMRQIKNLERFPIHLKWKAL